MDSVFCSDKTLAVDGITEEVVFIGVQPPSGSLSGDSENLGVELVIKHTNDQGGIHGRRLQSYGYKKQGDMADTLAHGQRLAEEGKVFCLFNHGGSPTVSLGTCY